MSHDRAVPGSMLQPSGALLDSPQDQAARTALVAQLRATAVVKDEQVLSAMQSVPRHLFVPTLSQDRAYDDVALPIGAGQTISQPFMVAYMTQLLELQPGDHVLEVGTGSGYQCAVLSRLCRRVTSVERILPLATLARDRLMQVGAPGVQLVVGDGSAGYPPTAPYDAILVTAAADDVPAPLLAQLAPGGRLVAPVGGPAEQVLTRWSLDRDGQLHRQAFLACRFVPLLGAHGRALHELVGGS